nr:EOG090X04UC [Polyphemus pediculus]
MLKAVENVAETFPQRKEETRRNLLNQLKALTVESDARKLQAIDLKPAAPEAKQEQSGMLSSYLEAVKEEPSKKKNVETKAKPQPLPPVPTHDPAALQSILGSLKVESTAKAQDPEFPFKRNERNERNLYDGNRSNVGSGFKLNGEKPFGIFEGAKFEDAESTPALSTWRKLYQRELELAVSHPPQNGFEQMIMWTRQGKLWQFPINNEQGLEEEAKVGFHEHIFMERHLEPWCPKRGPIRHFMELVCVGLSKNPYLTVAEKKEHILWFKNYFTDKRSLLAETGAIDTSPLNQLNV